MKTLLLLRHAKSSWREAERTDHERPLNSRGERDAPRIGQLLKDQNLVPELILSSTALRAKTTAAMVAQVAGYSEDLFLSDDLYLTGPNAYLQVTHDRAQLQSPVLLVGHNPTLERLVDLLTGSYEELPTAALVQIALPIEGWWELNGRTRGELVQIWRPRELP